MPSLLKKIVTGAVTSHIAVQRQEEEEALRCQQHRHQWTDEEGSDVGGISSRSYGGSVDGDHNLSLLSRSLLSIMVKLVAVGKIAESLQTFLSSPSRCRDDLLSVAQKLILHKRK